MDDAELADLRQQCLSTLYLCADNVSKYLEGEEQKEEFNNLKSYAQEYCKMDAQQEVAGKALEKTKRETDQSNIGSLESRFQAYLDSMAGRRLKVDNHPYIRELNKRMQRANLDESDIAITETQDVHIDPLTKMAVVDPMRNTLCGHIYEKKSIMNYIKTRKQKSICPVVGCGNREPIVPQDLIADEELRVRMTIAQHSTELQDRPTVGVDVDDDDSTD